MRKGSGCKPAQQVAPPLGCIPGLTRRPSPEEGLWTDILTVRVETQAQGGQMTCQSPTLKVGAQPLDSHYPLCLPHLDQLGEELTVRNGLRGSGKFADPLRGCERQCASCSPFSPGRFWAWSGSPSL